jgi:hypothetical protein
MLIEQRSKKDYVAHWSAMAFYIAEQQVVRCVMKAKKKSWQTREPYHSDTLFVKFLLISKAFSIVQFIIY